ncbi:hypothetical protein IJO12_05895 [bacterium]|nr:hypothetical protein [bacterium]
MINVVSNIDLRSKMNVEKPRQSFVGNKIPPLLGFKTTIGKEKAIIRVKQFRRKDNIAIVGEIDDNYVDIVEEDFDISEQVDNFNFFRFGPNQKKKTKYLKDSYIIDYIQAPQMRCGMGTLAIKELAEKAFFDPKFDGRIVTYSAPISSDIQSPALFFYKLGFRFIEPEGNERMKECLEKNTIDIPPQIGMMYLPKYNIKKLLRYGDIT